MRRLLFLTTIACSLALFAPAGMAQHDPAADETAAKVPALEKFHEVIYPLWHTAWPAKDVAALAGFLPAIETNAAAITAVTLPGILRDKKEAWDAGVAKLNASVAEYREAVAAKDSVKLLAVAERLHMQYEMLVRVIRPVMKELDEFHGVLYALFHYYWPEGNGPKMKEAAAGLVEKMAILEKGKLPKRHEAKLERFTAARDKLGAAVREFHAATLAEGAVLTKEGMADIVNKVHARYQIVEKVFE